MCGSRSTGLLVMFLLYLLFITAASRAQSGRTGPAADFGITPERTLQSPGRDPAPILPRPVSPGTFGFSELTRAAGTIFSGTVIAITKRPGVLGKALETVAITFKVESAMRGATPGESLTVSQWMGLWSSGQRYRVGERVLLFLYPPSKLGLTSCVAAPIGRFNIDPGGRVVLSAEHLSAFRTDPVLGGKSHATLNDFALAVQRAGAQP